MSKNSQATEKELCIFSYSDALYSCNANYVSQLKNTICLGESRYQRQDIVLVAP